MMLSLLCIFSGGKELSLSKCALTTAWGWPNSRSSVLSASVKRNADGINGKMGSTRFKTGDGGLVHLCMLVAD